MQMEMEMEGSFETRVSRVFGSLREDPAASGSSLQFWSINEQQQIDRSSERRKWDGDEEESGSDAESDTPCAARYERFLRLQWGEGEEARAAAGEREHAASGRPGKRMKRDGATADEGNKAVTLAGVQDKEDEEGEGDEEFEEEGAEDEVEQMRMMIGMDETLDFEDEEDEYDKVAVGREAAGDRIYMKEIRACNGMQSSLTTLPGSLYEMKQIARDSRANHAAAAARLAEDARVAATRGTTGLNQINGNVEIMKKAAIRPALKGANKKAEKEDLSKGPLGEISDDLSRYNFSDVSDSSQQVKRNRDKDLLEERATCGVTGNSVERPAMKKRVRFAEDLLQSDSGKSPDKQEHASVPLLMRSDAVSQPQQFLSSDNKSDRCSKVPDHVRHPWKYKHYTLDWSDDDDGDGENKNLEAFQAVRSNIETSSERSEQVVELPKSILFSPRCKVVLESKQRSLNECLKINGAEKVSDIEDIQLQKLPVGIAAGSDHEKDPHILPNVDLPSTTDADIVSIDDLSGIVKLPRLHRNYRSKANIRDLESPE
ncbi:hypothetical protein O6H91_11G033800 [Diphasiastrum complanatum]|uniref:Uncharacterized protein n=1 Tax=Diphasiastrum complanatum TaxID=34168 RepID=A0ACC2C7V1_DIPCM|nr:hypothetical protein O6H91_11G033800 [Diphasiastrum complanatum]